MNMVKRAVIAVALQGLGIHAQAAQCVAENSAGTTALVELYTSEGCDSCPPADRWLSSLGARDYAPDRVVPVALHVDYWDYIGWKDPYAKREFSARQRRLAQLKRARIVYTPQVLLQGQDFRHWRTGTFDEELTRINAQPARARITLHLNTMRAEALDVTVGAELLGRTRADDVALYLAAYENKLVSRVGAGENRGKTLTHDYVVFEWLGPIPFSGAGKVSERRSLPLLPKAVPENSGVVAFVQNTRTAEVLQALMLPACGP